MVYGGVETYGTDKTSQETPNTQSAILKYRDGKMLEFEVRGRYTYHESGLGIEVGNTFFGTEGYLELNGGTWRAFRGREKEPFASSKETDDDQPRHWANFLEGIRSEKNATLHGEMNEGFLSSALPLLCNISYLVQRELKIEGKDVSDLTKFVKDPEADALLTKAYRAPYVVPNAV
jgi:hypothetical protein